jgi:hypothetical protein
MVNSSNELPLFLKCRFLKCLDFSQPQVVIVILVAMGLMTSLLTRAYCDWTHLPLLNVAHEQPQLHVCPTSLAEIGRSHVKRFHTNFGIVQCCGESSHSSARVLRCCWMV